MNWRTLSALALSSVFIVACDESTPTSPTQPVNSTYTLAPGQAVAVQDSLSLRFKSVVQDNRCPGDALCITAGEAVLAFDAVQSTSSPSVTQPLELKTTPAGQVAVVGRYRIELTSVMPYPFASLPAIQPGDYRATLHVVSNN